MEGDLATMMSKLIGGSAAVGTRQLKCEVGQYESSFLLVWGKETKIE